MPEGSIPIIEACQLETHAAIQCAIVPAGPVLCRGRGMGSLLLAALFGCAMFMLGGSLAFYRNGVAIPIFARGAPEKFDQSILHRRQAEERVKSQAPAIPLHTAPAEEPTPVVSSSASSAQAVSEESSSSVSEEQVISPVPTESIPAEPPEPVPATSSSSSELSSSSAPEEIIVPEEPIVPEEVSSESSSQESSVGAEEPVPPPPVPHSSMPPGEIGVFFTQTSVKNERYFLQTLDRLHAMTGSALVFNVKSGIVHFHASAPLAEELDLIVPSYDLPEVIRQARERGVRTIGRFVALKDPNLAQALPETQIRHPKTNRTVGNVWVDPSHPQVIAHNEQIIRDLVAAGIDEINLDYIRYPTEYAQSAIGLTGNEKADRIEGFLRMARRVIDEGGGKTKLGISTYAILGWNFPVNFEPLGQDIARFAPLLDVISPMAYPSTFAQGAYYNPAKHPGSRMYYLVYRTLMGYRDLLGDQAWKLRPWIQGYGITQKNLRDEIAGVFDAGVCGFTVWNASNEYGIFMKMLPEIERPEQCSASVDGH